MPARLVRVWALAGAIRDLDRGGRRIFLATDRPISYREAVNQPRVVNYPFTFIEPTFIELEMNGEGEGEGESRLPREFT